MNSQLTQGFGKDHLSKNNVTILFLLFWDLESLQRVRRYQKDKNMVKYFPHFAYDNIDIGTNIKFNSRASDLKELKGHCYF